MLTDAKLIKDLNKAIAALELDREKKGLSTIDIAFVSGKIEAFKEVLNHGRPKKSKRKIKFFK